MAEPTLTHWKQLIDPRFIGAYALPNGHDLVVTIECVKREEITFADGRTENHSIMSLKGQKPMILNRVNSKSIQQLYGAYIEHWAGKQITLYASTARHEGELVECLRVRPTVPVPAKKGISAARLARALKQIQAGAYTLEQLRAGFALTPAQCAEVEEFAGSLAHE